MRTTTRLVPVDKTVPPPRLLVSIRDPDELEIALETEAPWIDVKEPGNGAMGRPALETAMTLYERFRSHPGERDFSIALGELQDASDEELVKYCQGFGEDVYWKIALAGYEKKGEWSDRLTTIIDAVGSPQRWILVHYADAEKALAPTWDEVLQTSKDLGSEIILVDTWEKNGKTLLDIIELDTLKHMSAHSHALGFQMAVAGSLRMEQLPTLREIHPSWIGFRSELCDERQRGASLSSQKLRHLLEKFQSNPPSHSPRTVAPHVIRQPTR